MSAHTTLRIRRSTAIRVLIDQLMRDVPDEELGRQMDDLLDADLFKCEIVASHDQDHDEGRMPQLMKLLAGTF